MSETITHIEKKTTIVPELRFKEFDGEWNHSKIEDHFEFKNGLNKEKEFFGRGTPIINFTDVYHREGITKDDIKGLVELSENEIKRYNALKGDVFFTRTSETIHDIGMSATLVEDIPNCVFSGFVLRARPTDNVLDVLYKKFCFQTWSVRKEIVTKSSFTTRALTSGTLLNKVEFSYPESLTEQQKIASFLSAVDEKILQLTRKKELLEDYKKGVMQQIFSQQIRFKDENGNDFPEWEEKRLGTELVEYKEKSIVTDQHVVLTSSNKGLMLQTEYYGENRLTERDNVGFNIVPEHYITFRSRSDNRTFTFNYNDLGTTGVISTYYPVFKSKSGSSKFIVELLNFSQNYVGKYSVGTSQTVLSYNELCRIKFSLPSHQEQKQIAFFINTLDKKIDQAKEQLTQTKTFKKGLLQKMFV